MTKTGAEDAIWDYVGLGEVDAGSHGSKWSLIWWWLRVILLCAAAVPLVIIRKVVGVELGNEIVLLRISPSPYLSDYSTNP